MKVAKIFHLWEHLNVFGECPSECSPGHAMDKKERNFIPLKPCKYIKIARLSGDRLIAHNHKMLVQGRVKILCTTVDWDGPDVQW